MAREERARSSEAHILVFPFPVQGHLNPIIQFSKRLASKGPRVTLVTTSSTKLMQPQPQASSINFESIFDGFEEGEKPDGTYEYLERFKTIVSQSLGELIEKQKSSKHPIKFLVYDSNMPWALHVARQLGIDGAPFFTQSCTVNSIYYQLHQGTLKIPLDGSMVSFPLMPPLETNDLPTMIHDTGLYPALVNLTMQQFHYLQETNCILINTFDKLEDEVVNWMASQLPIKTIGPTIPSMYLDKQLEDNTDYGLSLFKPNIDGCMKWLDSKENGSVVYVSFGSMATLGEEQMKELAWGLKRSNNYFLWVVRENEEKKFPSNFLEETLEKGLIVNWSSQLEVLAHKAVGCFMTHCGWNSTLEALSLGVPMVAIPQWTDQTTNAKFVADVWQTGVRVKVNEKGFVTREEIELCVREVMEGERGKEIKKNSEKWKILAKEAVDDGGSSDKNIEEFVAKFVCN